MWWTVNSGRWTMLAVASDIARSKTLVPGYVDEAYMTGLNSKSLTALSLQSTHHSSSARCSLFLNPFLSLWRSLLSNLHCAQPRNPRAWLPLAAHAVRQPCWQGPCPYASRTTFHLNTPRRLTRANAFSSLHGSNTFSAAYFTF